MADRKGRVSGLGELERAVLDHLWATGRASVLATHAAIGGRRGIAVNTVGSAMARLARKGLLRREKVAHAYHYEPAMEPATFRVRVLADSVGGATELAGQRWLEALVELLAATRAEALDELENLICRARGRAGG